MAPPDALLTDFPKMIHLMGASQIDTSYWIRYTTALFSCATRTE
jgi:hypothetical protein